MVVNDVIILTDIDPQSERSTQFTQTAFISLGQNSLSGYCQVSSRLTALVLYDAQNFPRGFPRKHPAPYKEDLHYTNPSVS